MNQQSRVGGLLRRLPSGVELREDRLERLSSLASKSNMVFATISIGVFIARSQSLEDQQKHAAILLIAPPTILTIAVFITATALALEQQLLIRRFLLLRPVFARFIVSLGFLMALIAAGCQLEVPATLTLDQLAKIAKGGLQRGYALNPNIPAVNWWVWLGQSYIFYSSVASSGLVGAFMFATGAWEFQYA